MNWNTFSEKFYEESSYRGFSKSQIKDLLSYAKTLNAQRLPIIFDQTHLSKLVGYDINFIRGVLINPTKYYREFKIKKKSGGERTISEPLPSLKEIQNWILRHILSKCKTSKNASAYLPNKSILDNARPHVNKSLVLKLDIKDFFPSVSLSKVIHLFTKLKYNKQVAETLARLCCQKGSIPQGSPTSPYISNLVMNHFDKRIQGFCKKNKIKYTRYADDITLSGNFHPGSLISFISMVLNEYKFFLNEKKTKVMRKSKRQSVTNLVVNNKKIQVQKKYRKKLRQEIFYIKKYGLESHIEKINLQKANYVVHLIGCCNYVLFVDPSNAEFIEYKEFLYSMK